MTDEHVKAVVKETIDALLGESMIKYSDMIIYEQISDRLREYYKTGDDPVLERALEKLKNHPHINLLDDYYRDNLTLEHIAEIYRVEVRTVSRWKKNLCIKIYKTMGTT